MKVLLLPPPTSAFSDKRIKGVSRSRSRSEEVAEMQSEATCSRSPASYSCEHLDFQCILEIGSPGD